jgi:hypothetical protein
LFDRSYGTSYLFMPPQMFVQTHLPDSPAWQLMDKPIDRGTALRRAGMSGGETGQPTAEKRAWEGIRIVEPSRSRAEVRGRFHVELDNPKGLRVAVLLLNRQDHTQEPCQPENGGTRHTCTVLGRGLYLIEVFAGAETPSEIVAQLEVLGT